MQKSKKPKLSTKEIVLIAVCTVVLIILESLGSLISIFLGTFAHTMSQAFSGLISAIVFVFVMERIPRRFVFSFMLMLPIIIYSLAALYLPFLLTYTIGVIIGELALGKFGYQSFSGQAIAYAAVHFGAICGQLVPAWFFPEKFVAHFIQAGTADLEQMNDFVRYSKGLFGLLTVVLTIGLPIVGVYFSRKIVARYQRRKIA
ncbi:MAG: MptD family putative ECF transporter S component [Eubacteriales bacterium]|nr:MptD family putative ECF transporter S component [Eubacteriales bacterium]